MNKLNATKKSSAMKNTHPTGSPKKQWTTQANEEMLVLIVQMYVKTINYDEIAAKLGGVTAVAVKQQWLRLKKRGVEEKGPVAGKKGVKRMLNFDNGLDEELKGKKKVKIEKKEEHWM
jgi:hypothetical protein